MKKIEKEDFCKRAKEELVKRKRKKEKAALNDIVGYKINLSLKIRSGKLNTRLQKGFKKNDY